MTVARDYVNKAGNHVRIKITPCKRKYTKGSVIINTLNKEKNQNIRIKFGFADLKKMIEEYEKERLKLRK
jgi:hypothetical protein